MHKAKEMMMWTEQKSLVCVWRQGEEKVREGRPIARQVEEGVIQGEGWREEEYKGRWGVKMTKKSSEDAQMTRKKETREGERGWNSLGENPLQTQCQS